MTKYCLQERAKVYNLYLEHFKKHTQDSYRNYVRAVQNFKDKFHKKFDPLNLIDDYDIFGITSYVEKGKPFIPMEMYKN
jgi:hypothetical protein